MRSLIEAKLIGSNLFHHFVRSTNFIGESLDEDIDLLVFENEREEWKVFLMENSNLDVYFFKRRSYVDSYYIKENNFFIQLDIEWNLSWHGLEILKPKNDSNYLEFFDVISKILRPVLWGKIVKEKYFHNGPLLFSENHLYNQNLNGIMKNNKIDQKDCYEILRNRKNIISLLKKRDNKNRSTLKIYTSKFYFYINEISLFLNPIGFFVFLPKTKTINFHSSINGRIPWREIKPFSFRNFSLRDLRDGVIYSVNSDFLNLLLKSNNLKKINLLIKLKIIND